MTSITPEAARLYLAQWSIVAEQEARQLRTTSMSIKFKQLAALMQSTRAFDDTVERRAAEATILQSRWQTIRRAYGV